MGWGNGSNGEGRTRIRCDDEASRQIKRQGNYIIFNKYEKGQTDIGTRKQKLKN
jgi:hypothetical protein